MCNVIKGSWSNISKVHTPIEGNEVLTLEDLKSLGELEILSLDAHSVVTNTSAMQLVRLMQLFHGNQRKLTKTDFLASLAKKVSLSLCVNFSLRATLFLLYISYLHITLLIPIVREALAKVGEGVLPSNADKNKLRKFNDFFSIINKDYMCPPDGVMYRWLHQNVHVCELNVDCRITASKLANLGETFSEIAKASDDPWDETILLDLLMGNHCSYMHPKLLHQKFFQ